MIDYAAALIAKMRAQYPRGGSGVPQIFPLRLNERPAGEVAGRPRDFVMEQIRLRQG